MFEKRYQVFYSTSGEDTRNERLQLTQALSAIGCFTVGLEQRTPLSSTLARRQIDESDYVVMLIGGKYGEQSVTGESYLHLEYKYAVTKNKPIIVFMAKHPELMELNLRENHPKLIERFEQFCDELRKNHEVIYYNNLRDLDMNIRTFMPKFIEKNPQEGWVQARYVEQLKQKLQDLEERVAKGSVVLSATGSSRPTSNQRATIITPIQEQYSFDHLPKVALLNNVSLEYRIHAYQDGNFRDVHLVRYLTWMQIIELYGKYFLEPTPEETFNKCMNDYLNDTALSEVQQKYPRVHAVARAQIDLKILKMVKEQLHHHEWFKPVAKDEKQRILWQITELGKQYLK